MKEQRKHDGMGEFTIQVIMPCPSYMLQALLTGKYSL